MKPTDIKPCIPKEDWGRTILSRYPDGLILGDLTAAVGPISPAVQWVTKEGYVNQYRLKPGSEHPIIEVSPMHILLGGITPICWLPIFYFDKIYTKK